jgi:hypothetical protein
MSTRAPLTDNAKHNARLPIAPHRLPRRNASLKPNRTFSLFLPLSAQPAHSSPSTQVHRLYRQINSNFQHTCRIAASKLQRDKRPVCPRLRSGPRWDWTPTHGTHSHSSVLYAKQNTTTAVKEGQGLQCRTVDSCGWAVPSLA